MNIRTKRREERLRCNVGVKVLRIVGHVFVQDNIWVSPDSTDAQLVISGGTIFNAGAGGGDPTKDMCNGITVNAGSFQITGTSIRNNKGRGVWVVDGGRQSFRMPIFICACMCGFESCDAGEICFFFFFDYYFSGLRCMLTCLCRSSNRLCGHWVPRVQ